MNRLPSRGRRRQVVLETIKCETEEQLRLVCLSVVEELSESVMDFIGEVRGYTLEHQQMLETPAPAII
jgi:hypothetical protein